MVLAWSHVRCIDSRCVSVLGASGSAGTQFSNSKSVSFGGFSEKGVPERGVPERSGLVKLGKRRIMTKG